MNLKPLTLTRLSNTNFEKLYKKLITDKELANDEKLKILELALVFFNSSSPEIKELGYRIIVLYCNKYRFYQPLYEIAINEGLYPIAKFIEIKMSERNFNIEMNSIFLEKYSDKVHTLTNQQFHLNEFYNKNYNENVAVIAPTSYGKSDLIINSIMNSKDKNIVIITPSKALLNQTKSRIIKQKIDWLKKLVVFPEMYSAKDEHVVAVLTQERLLKLLKDNPNLSFDLVIVDEAHDLLIQDERNLMLATCLIVLQKRNKKAIYKFLTPFLSKISNLKLRYTDYSLKGYNVSEHLKTEKYFIYDTRNHSGLKIYDQFMNTIYDMDFNNNLTDIQFIKSVSKDKNIVYFNRPYDIEHFATDFCENLNDINNKEINNAILNLANYLDDDYNLIKCIRKGVVYHHGSIPDNIRLYIEILYKNNHHIKYIITSSTLLEGVNIPASQIFIMDNRKGKGNLKPSDFKNLIGRVCRFGDIFNNSNIDLTKLEPNIFLVVSKYYKKGANIESFIKNTSKVGKVIKDDLTNVILENTEINHINKPQLTKSEEFIENYESGTIKDYNKRIVKTDIGKSCFLNNITEINIFDNEELLQKEINELKKNDLIISDTETLFNHLNNLFFKHALEDNNNLTRFMHKEARMFYKMFLDWRIKNATYKEMICSFINYWEKLKELPHEDKIVYVGSKWGEITRNGIYKLWVNIETKSHQELINLAIVKIKEEQDFLEHTIIKFIEVLNDMNLLEKNFYNKIKYGTDNEKIIFLMKHGLSYYLSKELINNFNKYLNINFSNETYFISKNIIEKMHEKNVNEVLILELEQFI